ncbi:MAG: family 10 glycosylhydrolase [Kiritimatiellae bacterium]|nr:family 10 glycosylhydrolase [Kiritimatiellia bacterium]
MTSVVVAACALAVGMPVKVHGDGVSASVVQDAPGYNSWPMVEAVGGKIVCAYSRGTAHTIDEGKRGVYAKTSVDGGKTWGEEVCVANDPSVGEVTIGKGLDDGGSMLLWVRRWGKAKGHDLYRTTDGKTFEKIASPKFSPMPMQVTDVFRVPGVGLMSLWFAGAYGNMKDGHSWGTLTSADNGRTWTQRTVEDNVSKADWPTEQSAVCLGGGRILAIARTEVRDAQFQLTSVDGGKTWRRERTNIRDVLISTPSLVFDPKTGVVHNYYYQRGAKKLKRRTAKADYIFSHPAEWPEPDTLAEGNEVQPCDAGNVNATRAGDRHVLAAYSGSPTNTAVFVVSVAAGKKEAAAVPDEVMATWRAIGDDASANACIVRGPGQPPVRYGDLTRKGSVELPVDGPNASVKWDFLLPCDLSNAKGVEFDFRCDDVSGLNGAMFYFKSGNGWYTRNIILDEEGKWCHVRMLRSGCGKEGEPGGWDAVKSMRINLFRNADRKTTTAAVADFKIIPAVESAAKVEENRARIDAEVREFVKSVPGKKGERRLVWCHSARGLGGRDWDGSVRFLKEQGFTDLIANLTWADRAFYASSVLPVDPSVAKLGDALEQCLAACRKWGVKCHVWRVCYNMGGRIDKNRIARFAAEGRLVKMFNAKGKNPWGHTFCPSHPDNVRLEVSAMEELAAKGVDGVHFDYIRYADQNFCFCDGCRKRFERDCGLSVANWPDDVRADKRLARKWADWRCSNITRVVREVAKSIRRSHPRVEISAAVRSSIPGAYTADGQDWVGWAKNGLVDFVCPMDYTPSTVFFRSTYRDQLKALAGARAKFYPGIGLSCWQNDGTDAMKMAKHIQALRRDGLEGFTVFNFDARAERAFPILSTGPTRAEQDH